MIRKMEKIKLPVNELLCGLAEECSELAQAALKLRRAYDQTNPTPVDPDDAYEKLCEEVADVFEMGAAAVSTGRQSLWSIK